ncbi:MAG: exosome complex exonuclease Rrp41 [Candidatus Aenigmarchaeota archaeon]|nr:exosome complex exonuclease Rrp41 [Candidatus Aenigmarchaeota archaeon]
MGGVGKPEKMIINGKRLDGRALDEFRPMEIEVGLLNNANGSATFKFGNTYALAAVQGPREVHPRHQENPQKTIIRCRYAMAPFSTKERIRPGRSRRATEISMVINEALSNVVFFNEYPKTAVDVFMEILQADASTRCAALNAASLALVDAGVPMSNMVSSCSVGKVDGQIATDLYGIEDNFGDVDMAVAMVGNEDKVVLLQMDGIITKEEMVKMLGIAKEGCAKINEKQKQAIREKYNTGDMNADE